MSEAAAKMSPELVKRLKDLYRLQKDLKIRGVEKAELQKEIEALIVENKLEDQKFEIGGDAFFIYHKKKVLQGLSQGFVKERLNEYFRGAPEADEIFKFILEGRGMTEEYHLDTTWKK